MKEDKDKDEDKDEDVDEDKDSLHTSQEPSTMVTELLLARFTVKKKQLPMDGPTDRRTDGQTLLQRCVDASKEETCLTSMCQQ